MKYLIIRLISTILFVVAVLSYMSENSSVFDYSKEKTINKNRTPIHKSVVTSEEHHFVPTVKIAL
jgi:hypothetical protein